MLTPSGFTYSLISDLQRILLSRLSGTLFKLVQIQKRQEVLPLNYLLPILENPVTIFLLVSLLSPSGAFNSPLNFSP